MEVEKSAPFSQEWRNKISLARGSIWPEIERYARLRMTPREIQLALELEGKQIYPYPKVENALRKAWRRGILEKRAPEETKQTSIDRVSTWLTADRQLDDESDPLRPNTRNQWLGLIALMVEGSQLLDVLGRRNLIPHDTLNLTYILDLYRSRKRWSETGDRTLVDNFPVYYEQQDPEIARKLAKQIAIIREITPLRANRDRTRLEGAMAISSEPDKR